jgi:hypothetical protein
VESEQSAQKIMQNIATLLKRANIKQLRIIYLVAFEIIKKA